MHSAGRPHGPHGATAPTSAARGTPGVVIARAPVRISFGGGGTDLPAYYNRFGGLVVSAAITRYAYATADDPADGSITVSSADYGAWEVFAPGQPLQASEPLALPEAMLAEFLELGLAERGVDLFLAAQVPPGTGLGSSSAMAVAVAAATGHYLGVAADRATVAERASIVEIERLGMPIGRQDQYASAFGGLNTIEFSADGVSVTPLNLCEETRESLQANLLLFSTGTSRHSARILQSQQRATRDDESVIAGLHRIKDLALEMRDALLQGNLDAFGVLLHESWQEKRGLTSGVSSEQIDRWYEEARHAGAVGGKITGAGGGGFLLLYAPVSRHATVRAAMRAHGLQEMRFAFDMEGVAITRGFDRREAGHTATIEG